MAEANWTLLSNSIDIATVDRGVTAGIARPNGGGSFLYGFNSKAVTPGAVGLFANQSGFAPMASGGTVRAAIQRGVSAGDGNFSGGLFICLGGSDVADEGYFLGFGDDDPSHIVLYKGALSGGIPDATPDPDGNGILMRSTAAYAQGTWVHVRLDAIVQGTGDVLLQVYQNNLGTNAVTAPSWAVMGGMEGPQYPTITGFVDDALGINTGSAPFTSGRGGFFFESSDVGRRMFFDHVVVGRQ